MKIQKIIARAKAPAAQGEMIRIQTNRKAYCRAAFHSLVAGALTAAVWMTSAPEARGCACGCGVFDVATADMFPKGGQGMLYAMYDFSDQNHNWSETHPAPDSENGDKRIETQFTAYGMQYLFNADWGIQVEVPYDYRSFTTTSGAPGSPLVKLNWSGIGDVRVEGIYSGFSSNQNSGITFGLKLPTGSYAHNDPYDDIDRDSELGSGSTDVLLGYYHHQKFSHDENWSWYAQALLDVPVLIQNQYRPGVELDSAAGVYYTGWHLGHWEVAPVESAIFSERTSDTGALASGGALDGNGGDDSGYQRLMLSQGIELHLHPYPVSFYADVEVPVFQDFRGNQVASTQLFKVMLSYHF